MPVTTLERSNSSPRCCHRIVAIATRNQGQDVMIRQCSPSQDSPPQDGEIADSLFTLRRSLFHDRMRPLPYRKEINE
jgi:hypothetical protein